MPRRGPPGKHTVYFELLDACKKGGCPICTMVVETVARYLDAVIYENVNDPPTRDAVVASRGYCNEHSWTLRERAAGFGTALMYRDVLRHVVDEIDRRPDGAGLALFGGEHGRGAMRNRLAALAGAEPGDRGQGRADPRVACPACQTRERYELLYLRTLLEHLADKEFVEAYRSSGGLCLVHLDQALGGSRDAAALERLLSLQRERMMALLQELSEFIRKHDYRFRAEGMGVEGSSWIRAIEMVAGKRGIR